MIFIGKIAFLCKRNNIIVLKNPIWLYMMQLKLIVWRRFLLLLNKKVAVNGDYSSFKSLCIIFMIRLRGSCLLYIMSYTASIIGAYIL